MRYIILVILCAASICLGQEKYHNEEYAFSIDVPANWHVSTVDQWPAEVKGYLEQHYLAMPLFMLNPLGVEVPSSPCIRVFGGFKDGKLKSDFAFNYFKKNGKKMLTSKNEKIAKELVGDNIRQYRKIDIFYNYDSSKNYGIANILYKHNEEDRYLTITTAKLMRNSRSINFEGYWAGAAQKEFLQAFTEVVESCKFGLAAKPKEVITDVIDSVKINPDAEPEKEALRLIWKWLGIILTISIILGIVKWMFGRTY